MAEYIKRTARCKDCLHFDICCEDWAYESEGKYTADEYRATMADKVPCANHFKPTADVIEVVYCKNCKFRGKEYCPMSYYLEIEGDYVDPMEDYDFCSYGE